MGSAGTALAPPRRDDEQPGNVVMHVGAAPQPHDLWTSWSVEPAVIAGPAAAAVVYARGVRALWRRGGRRGRGVAPWRVWCYASGLLAVFVALVSPLDAVGGALFSAHMVQHLVLVVVAAPLIALGEPLVATLWAFPLRVRRAAGRWARRRALRATWAVVSAPLVVWVLHVGTMWVWHAPRLYESALRHPAVHALEHASFFVPALLFWWLLADRRSRRRLGFGGSLIFLFTAGLQSTVLGALITVAQRPWYLAYYDTTRPWGLTPLEDQQLAGLVMWVPASFVYLAALVALFAEAMTERAARERPGDLSHLVGTAPHASPSRP
jgi:cytochrome c oxidase assembly factor CtaG